MSVVCDYNSFFLITALYLFVTSLNNYQKLLVKLLLYFLFWKKNYRVTTRMYLLNSIYV
ncbi:hypothetical protein CHU_1069 [Cytophaga hutchinsonii ATCC 33406]|uniref:Uncharacterized protein n=1 Tax=Cytophaga hutchinsonii (strain ATCC 33406 / DSM 1761 / CIP 103989 / NBRC 15051 / NCIMB 9469 / D465) TaxID=269798 RepID=A0A6N4SQ09_CYTH3|nr:hypothetical protein CHU_1069 [Cytophaga hutchinsonii ATCC 33406]